MIQPLRRCRSGVGESDAVDLAFFRKYQSMNPKGKEQLREVLKILDDVDGQDERSRVEKSRLNGQPITLQFSFAKRSARIGSPLM